MSDFFTDSLTSFTAGITADRSKTLSSTYSSTIITQSEINAMYRTSWLPKAIVDRRARDMFRKWRDWQGDADQITKIERVEADLDLKQKYQMAKTYARLDGAAYVFFDNGEDTSKPLNIKTARPLRFVNVILKSEIICGDIDDDPMSQYYGDPAYYEVMSTGRGMIRINPSRVVKFTGTPRPNGSGWHREYDPVLIACADAIKMHDMVVLNVADMTSEAKLDIISVKGLMKALQDPATERAVLAKFALMSSMKNSRSVNVLDADTEEWQQKTMSFATLPDIIDKMQIEVSGAAGYPRALLFGVTEGGMGSTGNLELSSYYDSVNAEQENEIRPATHHLDRMVVKTAIGKDDPDVHYTWASLWQESDEVKTANGVRIADMWSKLVDKGIFPADMISESVMNSLVEAGCAPGLEAAFGDWVASNDDLPGDTATKMTDAAPRSLYVSRKVLNAPDIIKWAKSQGFTSTLDASDLHVTVCYSRKPIDWMDVSEDWNGRLNIEGGARIVEQFDGGANVLQFKSEGLEYRHAHFIDAGATWDHAEYQPHITISYGEMPENVEPYQGVIMLGPEIFAPVNDNWRGDDDTAMIGQTQEELING